MLKKTEDGSYSISSPVKLPRHLPGEEGVWVFIFGDLLVFGAFFVTFVFYRAGSAEMYRSSQDLLNRNFGLINTMFLLTSSWLVASAVKAARNGRHKNVPALLMGGIALGFCFVIVKAIEYSEKIAGGFTLNYNEFFIFYYMLTGIHLIHVILGLSILTFLTVRARGNTAGADYIATLEGGATFWHLVDLLWIILFALLYLMR